MKTNKTFFLILFFGLVNFAFASNLENIYKTQSFKVSKGGTLLVDVNPGDITIRTWDKLEVFVKVSGLDENELRNLELAQDGNTVKITYSSSWGWSSDANFEISIPAEFNLSLETTGGDVDVKNNLNGDVSVKTAGGDVDFKNVKGEIEIHTAGGDIKIGDATGKCQLKTMGGDITVGVLSGKEAKVSTMGGDISIVSSSSTLDVNTYGGDINIGDVGGDATVTTYGGDINLKKIAGSASLNTFGGDIRLDGANGKVKADTKGGSIVLKNVTGSVNAKSAGGDISIDLTPSGNAKSTIQTAHGEITLYLPASAKASISAEIRLRGWWDEVKDGYNIESDFAAVSTDENEDKKSIRKKFKVNGGGQEIELSTVNSSIKILKK